jgi:hypothetical protein
LFFSAIASAAAFTNDHHVGRYIYAAAAGIAGMGAAVALVSTIMPIPVVLREMAIFLAVIIGFVISWIRPFRVLYA